MHICANVFEMSHYLQLQRIDYANIVDVACNVVIG